MNLLKDRKSVRKIGYGCAILAFMVAISGVIVMHCAKAPAGPPWIDGDHGLDWYWTYEGGPFIAFEIQGKSIVAADTFAFLAMAPETTFVWEVLEDGAYQLRVRAQSTITGLVGSWSPESDTVWSSTIPLATPGKPWWID